MILEKWGKLYKLSGWQREVLLRSPYILFLTWLRLRTGGFKKTLGRIQPGTNAGLSPDEQLALARETTYALAVAIKYGPWKPRCLVRSLALGWFLARQGIPFNIRIGVPREKPGMRGLETIDFSAHAWLEHGNVVLNDKEDIAGKFNPFELGSGKA